MVRKLEYMNMCPPPPIIEFATPLFASYVFPDKNQKPLRMCRMQITKQAVVILSLISGNAACNERIRKILVS